MKYRGSKERVAKELVPIIQKYIDDNDIHYYMEPFCGGCSLIEKIKCDRKFAYDKDKYLINLLVYVKNGGVLPDAIPKELYDKARKAWYSKDTSGFKDWEIGCIEFLSSFGGGDFTFGYAKDHWEKTAKGEKLRQPYQEAKRNILKQAERKGFQEIMFGISDYKDLKMEDLDCRHVIVCDPPYNNTKKYANAQHFDYEEFWNIMRKWSERHIVLICELNAPDDFECIWEKSVTRTIKASDKTIRANEKLFILKSH